MLYWLFCRGVPEIMALGINNSAVNTGPDAILGLNLQQRNISDHSQTWFVQQEETGLQGQKYN